MTLTRFDYLSTSDYATTTIPAASSLSGEVDLGGMNATALVVPSTWDAADITLQASFDGGTTWHDVVGDDGAEYVVSVTPGAAILLSYMDLEGFDLIRLRSGTSAAPVNQAADREIGVVAAK